MEKPFRLVLYPQERTFWYWIVQRRTIGKRLLKTDLIQSFL